jgi:predicted secreted protein
MTAHKGYNVILKIGDGATPTESFANIGSLRSTSFKLDNKVLDSSNLASGKWRRLLGAGIDAVTIKGSGYFTDIAAEETLRGYAFANSSNNYELDFGNGDKLTGAFIVAGYSRSGDLKSSEGFDITLESAGVVVFTTA